MRSLVVLGPGPRSTDCGAAPRTGQESGLVGPGAETENQPIVGASPSTAGVGGLVRDSSMVQGLGPTVSCVSVPAPAPHWTLRPAPIPACQQDPAAGKQPCLPLPAATGRDPAWEIIVALLCDRTEPVGSAHDLNSACASRVSVQATRPYVGRCPWRLLGEARSCARARRMEVAAYQAVASKCRLRRRWARGDPLSQQD